MRLLNLISSDLRRGQNLESYVVIALALLIGVFGVAGAVSVTTIQATILATLSLFAFSTLSGRRQMAELTEAIRSSSQPGLSRRISTKLVGLEDSLRDAKDLRISGVTLTRLMTAHRSELHTRLLRGAKIRAILIDPDGNGVAEAGRRCIDDFEDNYYLPRLNSAIGMFRELARSAPTGSLELRLLPFLPAFSMTIIDPQRPGGRIYVEQYHHRTTDEHPTMRLDHQSDHGSWLYEFYLGQFEILWRDARYVDLVPALSHSSGTTAAGSTNDEEVTSGP